MKKDKNLNHSLNNRQNKNKTFEAQSRTIFTYLQTHTATNTMVSYNTNIPQKNICRIKRDLEKRGLLQETYKKLCKITGFRAWYLTTNNALFKFK